MAFTLKQVKEQAGIVDIDFLKAATLADNAVVFCIHAVDIVSSQFSDEGQWRLKISCSVSDGTNQFFYLSLSRDERRDQVFEAVKDALVTEHVIHSNVLVARSFKSLTTNEQQTYYNLQTAVDDNKDLIACDCEGVE